jgi:hypothetical protein
MAPSSARLGLWSGPHRRICRCRRRHSDEVASLDASRRPAERNRSRGYTRVLVSVASNGDHAGVSAAEIDHHAVNVIGNYPDHTGLGRTLGAGREVLQLHQPSRASGAPRRARSVDGRRVVAAAGHRRQGRDQACEAKLAAAGGDEPGPADTENLPSGPEIDVRHCRSGALPEAAPDPPRERVGSGRPLAEDREGRPGRRRWLLVLASRAAPARRGRQDEKGDQSPPHLLFGDSSCVPLQEGPRVRVVDAARCLDFRR